jgi:hypothetical protein
MMGDPFGEGPRGALTKELSLAYLAGVEPLPDHSPKPRPRQLSAAFGFLGVLAFGFDRLINQLIDDIDSRRNFCLLAAPAFNKFESGP